MNESSHPFWSRCSLALVINLDDRPERWRLANEAAATFAPLGRMQRQSAVKGVDLPGFGQPPWFRSGKRDRTWAGRAGCMLSHRAAITQALAQHAEWLLLLEDDLLPAPDCLAALSALGETLAERDDWIACYLGFTDAHAPFRSITPLGDRHTLFQIGGANTTHAYLLHRRAFAPLLAQLPDATHIWPWLARHRAIDRWYRRHLWRIGRVLAVSPSLIDQRAGWSDIVGRETHATDTSHRNLIQAKSRYPRLVGLERRSMLALNEAWDVIRASVKRFRGL
jgi:glycosyl transferase, family 25